MFNFLFIPTVRVVIILHRQSVILSSIVYFTTIKKYWIENRAILAVWHRLTCIS